MKINKSELNSYLNTNDDLTVCRLIVGHHNGGIDVLRNMDKFSVLKAENPSDLKEKLNQLLDDFPNEYTLLLSTKVNSVPSVVYYKSDSVAPVPVAAPVNGHSVNVDEIREQVRKEIELDRLKNEKDNRIKELEDEVKRISEPGYKLTFVLEQLITKYFLKGQIAPVNGLNGVDMDNITDEQLETALAALIDALGEETILKLAEKLKNPENQGIIGIVKNFANG